MILLGIESSCDETAAALLETPSTVLSSVVASQVSVHSQYGGVVPELACREHVQNLCYVVEACLASAQPEIRFESIDGIAATRGPGLVGALLVGLTYAKGLAYTLSIPFLGINHLEGHICSIYLDHPEAEVPALALVVSGGHTSLFHVPSPGRYERLARTRDDAAGEALDKLSKALGFGYPGGPIIEKLALRGVPDVSFAIPKMSDGSLDFSFSGLKSAALRHIRSQNLDPHGGFTRNLEETQAATADLAASFQRAVIDQLLNRLDAACLEHEVRSIQISGGVSCNSALRRRLTEHFEAREIPVYFPRPELTTDNAVMIAAAAASRFKAGDRHSWDLAADPNLPVVTG